MRFFFSSCLCVLPSSKMVGSKTSAESTTSEMSTVSDHASTMADLIGGSSITTTKLNGSPNVIWWSASITNFLISKDKLHYIEEKPPKQPDAKWVKDDAQVQMALE